jgi:mannosyltransferase OCH1-like enzyme
MKIPRILNQTWKDDNIPDAFRQMADTWRRMHTNWEYVLWTDEMNRNFVKQHFSYFLPIYDAYESNIQRVDAVRYFVLFKMGGIYIDVDFECLANIESVLANDECVFGKEPKEHCAVHGKDIIISNAFMGAVPGSPFLKVLCSELMQKRHLPDHPNDRILESTGPFMLSRTYMEYEKKEEIRLLEPELIYPLTKSELHALAGDRPALQLEDRLSKALGIHHYAGTWWKK